MAELPKRHLAVVQNPGSLLTTENEQIPLQGMSVNLPWFGKGGFDSQPFKNTCSPNHRFRVSEHSEHPPVWGFFHHGIFPG